MSKMCAWASMSEHGSTEGTPGDQTGTEVKRGDWYQFGQTRVFRWKNAKYGRAAARLAGGAALNDYIGYGQSDRLTFYHAWHAVDWDISRLHTACNTDCSAFVAAIINALGVVCNPGMTTFTMEDDLRQTGKFLTYTAAEYLTNDSLLIAGDIVCNPSSHVIMVTDDQPPADGPIRPEDIGDLSTPALLAFLVKKRRYL